MSRGRQNAEYPFFAEPDFDFNLCHSELGSERCSEVLIKKARPISNTDFGHACALVLEQRPPDVCASLARDCAKLEKTSLSAGSAEVPKLGVTSCRAAEVLKFGVIYSRECRYWLRNKRFPKFSIMGE